MSPQELASCCTETSQILRFAAKGTAAPLQSFYSLAPTRVTRSSAASGAYPSPQPLPSPKPTASHTCTPSRLQAPASSAAQRSERLDKLYAVYTNAAGRPSARRSISVGRRSSSDIAASLNRSLDLGIGSLGARSQPLQPLTSARSAAGSRAAEPILARSSSRSRENQEVVSSRTQVAQPDQLSSARSPQQGSGMRSAVDTSRPAYGELASTGSVSGRSSLVERRSSGSFLEEEGLTPRAQRRTGGNLPLTSESASELSSMAPLLSR